MISDEQLNAFREAGTRVRVVRDFDEKNDVRGIVVAWDEQSVLVRKMNKRVVKLDRNYRYQPIDQERLAPEL